MGERGLIVVRRSKSRQEPILDESSILSLMGRAMLSRIRSDAGKVRTVITTVI